MSENNLESKASRIVLFGFDDNRNLCSHAGVCVYVCMCVCIGVCVCVCVCVVTPACKHDISRREAQTVLIFGM